MNAERWEYREKRISHLETELERLQEEVKQSAYYRECRDKWRDQAESSQERIATLEEALERANESLRQERARNPLTYREPPGVRMNVPLEDSYDYTVPSHTEPPVPG